MVGLLLDFTGDGVATATATAAPLATATAAPPPATSGLLPVGVAVPAPPSGASGRLVSMTSLVTSLEEELAAGAFAAFSMYERGMVSVMGGREEEGVGVGEAGAEGGADSSDKDHLSRRLPTVSRNEEIILDKKTR